MADLTIVGHLRDDCTDQSVIAYPLAGDNRLWCENCEATVELRVVIGHG